jgi:hypothetical protein
MPFGGVLLSLAKVDRIQRGSRLPWGNPADKAALAAVQAEFHSIRQ